MPKERRSSGLSSDRSKASPFPCSSSHSRRSSSRNPLESAENVKEWEEARCPVCMEHPHNALLLLCASKDKGCRPYMCDTSYRHSNCFDQFRKAFAEQPPAAPIIQDSPVSSDITSEVTTSVLHHGSEVLSEHTGPCENQEQPKLSCPLCRGLINGWIVEEPARKFLNAKVRTCAQENCVFSGTYAELRKHARHEHPLARPSEVDPERQREWRRMERQRDLGDVLSTFQSAFGEERGEDGPLSFSEGSLLTVYFLIRVFPPGSGTGSRWSVPSRFRGVSRSRRRTLWGESYDGEAAPGRELDNVLEGMHLHRERSRRSTTPDDEQSS